MHITGLVALIIAIIRLLGSSITQPTTGNREKRPVPHCHPLHSTAKSATLFSDCFKLGGALPRTPTSSKEQNFCVEFRRRVWYDYRQGIFILYVVHGCCGRRDDFILGGGKRMIRKLKKAGAYLMEGIIDFPLFNE
ncbi:MAG: hypothetical protein FWE21_10435 [Defluviitaleaceae bacterium]|nr:hypothetical protein [Defluviitaleaceae bacterium]